MADPGSQLARIQDLDENRYIVLHPVTISDEGAFSPVLAGTMSFVKIRTEEEALEVYHDYRFAPPPDPRTNRPGKYALTALGLGRIAQAAGIQVVGSQSIKRQRDRETGDVYVEWQVVGGVRQPNGELVFRPATATLDTFSFARERRQAYEEQIREGRHLYKYDDKKGHKKGEPRFTEQDIPQMVQRDVIQLEAKLEERVETLAISRLTRNLLSLKQVYTEEEIAKPFAVPRLIYRPDLTDPMMLERVQLAGRRAADELYGGSSPVSSNDAGGPLAEVRSLPDHSSATGAADTPGVVEERAPRETGEAGAARPAPAADNAPQAAPVDPVDEGPKPPRTDRLLSELLGPGVPANLGAERTSRVAEINPGFLHGVLQGRLKRDIREEIEGWLNYTHPTLGSS